MPKPNRMLVVPDAICSSLPFPSLPVLALKAAGRDDSSMNLLQGDMFIVRYRPIRSLVLEGRVDLI